MRLIEIRAHETASVAVPPTPAIVTPDGRSCWYPSDAILTTDDVAGILGVAPKTVRAMEGLRIAYATPHRPFVLYRWLVEYLEARAA